MIIEEQIGAERASTARVHGDNFPLPLGVEQVLKGAEILWARKLGIVVNRRGTAVTHKSKYMFSLRVHVFMPAVPPL